MFDQGWDWGPKLMTCGPWKPVYLETYESRIADMSVRTFLNLHRTEAEIQVSVDIEGDADYAEIEIGRNGQIVATATVNITHNSATKSLIVKYPELWWPFTLGPQNLYQVTLTLLTSKEDSTVLDIARKTFGVRKIELVQAPFADQEGSSFFFRINDTPIFAAGSCWIPADSFLPRTTPEKYRQWIKLARDSNQVMIRVWGGGIYEHDAFYDACDELGVMVWQDFMFACGLYPAYPGMQESIKAEATQNVKLLRHHPSIVVWCGNNEDYVIPLLTELEYDPDEKDPEIILKSSFPARYFYEHLLPDVCKELTPDLPYWPGSPFGGAMVNSHLVGDIHQWHVWHLEKAPYQDLPRLSGRFASEFGMQAAPCLRTVREFFPPGDTMEDGRDYATNEYMLAHNKCKGGPETLAQYIASNVPHQTRSLRRYVYDTQLIQSETLSTAYRSWRRLWRGPGREYCAGALVWQLNDCWPVTSWAIADYKLRPKMAYWAVKRENRPITAGLARVQNGETTTLEAWAVNMTLKNVMVEVQINAWDVESGELVWNHHMHKSMCLWENRSTELGSVDLSTTHLCSGEQKNGDDYRNIVFAIYIRSEANSASPFIEKTDMDPEGPHIIAQHVNFHEPLLRVPLRAQADGFRTKIISNSTKTWVELSTSVPMKGVLVETVDDMDVEWDDNGVDLIPGQLTRLGVSGLRVGDETQLKFMWLGGDWSAERHQKLMPAL